MSSHNGQEPFFLYPLAGGPVGGRIHGRALHASCPIPHPNRTYHISNRIGMTLPRPAPFHGSYNIQTIILVGNMTGPYLPERQKTILPETVFPIICIAPTHSVALYTGCSDRSKDDSQSNLPAARTQRSLWKESKHPGKTPHCWHKENNIVLE